MTRPLMVAGLLLLFVSFACAADNLSFSIVTSTGTVPVTGMVSYQLAESGNLSAWADLLYLSDENSLAFGLSARHAALKDLLPLVKGGGVCAYWSHFDCVKVRVYIINVSF